MPLHPGEAEAVAASNAREAAQNAQSDVYRLQQRLRQIEAHLGIDTRSAYEKICDHFAGSSAKVAIFCRTWRGYVKNPTPCMVVIEDQLAYAGATWQEVWDQISAEGK